MSKSTALVEIRSTLATMAPEFRSALPAHITPERFIRTAQTALNMNPDIVDCDRRSIYGAVMKAAQDGLVLDGREAALVRFRSKAGDQCQYMPMVAGILKKARNSGEISTISAHVVYSNDTFNYTLGDDEKIEHKPCLTGERGKPMLVYAVATFKDGGKQRAIMTVAEIERVRAVSRAKDGGPWVQWWDEMAKKTVIRRLAKYLPSAADRDEDEVQRVVERDDELYQPAEPEPEVQPEPAAQPAKRRTRASTIIEAKANEVAPLPIDEPPPPASPDDYGTDTTSASSRGEDLI
jgi:recombination protein RecT